MINQIRLRQQQQQAQTLRDRRSPRTAIGIYLRRDEVTGDRLLQSPDGSIARVTWIANSDPQAIPPLIVLKQTIGQSGYASQSPSR